MTEDDRGRDEGLRGELPSAAEIDCPWCGEPGHVQVDISGGRRQELVEDCWVCCRPIVFEIEIDRDGTAMVRVSAETD
jgi:hypothetical protein